MLLDTHVLIWYAIGDPRLSQRARQVIHRAGNHYSLASIWEAAIKSGLGKLDLLRDGGRVKAGVFFGQVISALQLKSLAITFEDAAEVETLPSYHSDPFDRLLVAQTMRCGLELVSADQIFDKYGVKRIW
jgi:PIN domain nuclease of toxin-antitoxin system